MRNLLILAAAASLAVGCHNRSEDEVGAAPDRGDTTAVASDTAKAVPTDSAMGQAQTTDTTMMSHDTVTTGVSPDSAMTNQSAPGADSTTTGAYPDSTAAQPMADSTSAAPADSTAPAKQ